MTRHACKATALVALAVALVAGTALAGSGSSIRNGTYRTTFTKKDFARPGISAEDRAGNLGTWTLTLSNGRWTLVDRTPPGYGPGDHITGTYSSSGGVVTFLHKTPKAYAGVAPKVIWRFDGKALHLKPVSGFPALVVRLIWTAHPWLRVR
jgi:hypothetical protein